MNRQLPFHTGYILVLVISLMGFGAVGCATQNVPADIAEDIVEGANSIVLEREAMTEPLTPDAPALAFYTDARQMLENLNYGIARADEDALILTTTPKRISNDLYLKLNLNVRPAPGGSELLGSAEWSTSPTGPWRPASWTTGPARTAFGVAVEDLSGLAHADLYTAVE